MDKPKKNWSEYYEITKAKPPTKLLVQALEYVTHKNKAIDIGGGALKDTRFLLDQGFDVTVIDKEPMMAEYAESLKSKRLHYFVTSFDSFEFPENEYDLASAMFALPFNSPETFDATFEKIKKSLKEGGIFCGQFFGINDEWRTAHKKMTFHTKKQVNKILEGFEILFFEEMEENSATANGTPKHWHLFHIIARSQKT